MERQRQRQKLNTAQILYILDSRLRGNDGGGRRELRRRRKCHLVPKFISAREKKSCYCLLCDLFSFSIAPIDGITLFYFCPKPASYAAVKFHKKPRRSLE
ncbi:MAG: hypothetical protein HAW59_02480 [Betaproteobacteria bacterium]|nr:hypothetical protein [Betaproteobacteria bacterium]